MTIDIGTKITHRGYEYEITAKIDHGGFGRVFRARRKPSGPDIAVKVPADEILADPIWRKKFAREARILANVEHTNVVKIVSFWKFPDGDMALAQELIEGATTLIEYVSRKPDHAPSVLLQVLYALRAIHGAGRRQAAIHRDLSPRNILVSPKGVVKVIDFGLAMEDPRGTKILTAVGDIFGTRGCMAPEQERNPATVDGRADLFALGRSMAAAIQGRSPQYAEPRRMQEPWRTICGHLAEHDRSDRPKNASAALIEAFSAFAEHDVPIKDMRIHISEMENSRTLAGWPAVCDQYYKSLKDVDQTQLALASRLRRKVFQGEFDTSGFFDLVESSSSVKALDDPFIDFEDLDPLGTLYEKLYRALDIERKKVCFRRVARLAVDNRRYDLMRSARKIYSNETKAKIAKELLRILDEVDPEKIIEGRGAIPGR